MIIRISKKLLQIRLLYFLFTIPHKVVFKNLSYFSGTANLRNNSLLVRTISIAFMIPCQRPFNTNFVFICVCMGGEGAVGRGDLRRSLKENSCSDLF